jgi:AAA+ ATPase superfamily predicted ATPase
MAELRNPFRVAEHVRAAFFTDRAEEVAAVRRAMADRARLLVTGPRRMGKSTVIGVGAERVESDGGLVLVADLATASSLTEVANRLLRAVASVEPWRDRLAEWARTLAPVVTLGYDASGLPRLSVAVESRPRGGEGERALLESVLDRVEAVASEASSPVVVVLDEFQRIAELGGEPAEWLLRRRMQENRATGYVCAGSKESLIAAMLQPQRAFYKFFDRLDLGPIDPAHMARWIDSRLTGAGVEADGVGRELVERVGPRTQDIVQAARVLWFRSAPEGAAGPGSVDGAIVEIVTQDDPALRRTFDDLTPLQQRILRAVAAGADQLHSTATRERFGLGAASSVATGLEALVSRSILVRTEGGVRFDNPYFREWARRELVV